MTDKEVTELPDNPAQLKNVIRQKLAEIRQLEHHLGLALQSKYGPRSERIDPAQRSLFELDEPEASQDEDEPATSPSKRRPGHGRRRLPKDLPRKRQEHDLEESEKACPCCGKQRKRIGFDVSERLEWKPAELHVIEHARAKYACADCEENVSVAARVAEPIPRGMGAPGLYAGITVGKYGDHLPLYRMEEILSRSGFSVSRSTQCDWMRQLADLSRPIVDRMADLIRGGDIIWTDDTTVPVLDPSQNKTKTGRFWVYIGDAEHRYAVFDYTPNRQRAGPETWLGDWRGYLQADAYPGYDRLCASDLVTEVACWAHARRKFHEARDSARAAANAALSRIGQLYRLEKRALENTPEQRLQMRQRYANETLKSLRNWFDEQLPLHLPKSPMGSALRYAISNWEALHQYTTDGRLSIDNNLSERTIRCVAIGRKNWMFAGSDQGGRTAAVHFSLVATCKLIGLDPFRYLHMLYSELPKITDPAHIDRLLPDRYLAEALISHETSSGRSFGGQCSVAVDVMAPISKHEHRYPKISLNR